MLTLYKNDSNFKKKVMKEYKDWIKENPQDSKSTKNKSKEEDTKSKEEVHEKYLSFHNKEYDSKIKELQEKYKSDFDKIEVTKEDIEKGSPHLNFKLQGQVAKGLSEHLKSLNLYYSYKDFLGSWQSSSDNPDSLKYVGLFKKLGVNGTLTPFDTDYSDPSRSSSITSQMENILKEVYAFQQAFFRSKGIKSITLYRGVKAKSLNPEFADANWGSKAKLQTRTISSFSGNALKANGFTGYDDSKPCLMRYEIPVERIFVSPVIESDLSITPSVATGSYKEEEYIIMGAYDLIGTKVKLKIEGGYNDEDYYQTKYSIRDTPDPD
jgi:hypothetical protein